MRIRLKKRGDTVAVVDRAHTDLDAANSMALLYPHPKWLSRESWALIFILFNQISCLWECHIPSFYMNVGHFSEYSGHPNNKFQTFLKNSRVQVGVYLWCTKICIFQSRFCTIFFKIFCSVFPEKFMKNHFHFANLFTGLGFSTCTFLWNRAS